jgi:hypothetical protein
MLFNVSGFGVGRKKTVMSAGPITRMRRFLVHRDSAQGNPSALKTCPVCASQLSDIKNHNELVTHNPQTCRLVNIVLSELKVSVPQTIRVNIYPGAGPLRGFYFTEDPYTIHISEEAYRQLREYIIFHETKHLVDCLQFGRSEEVTPDRFARSLCVKYGYRCPPENLTLPWFAYA